VVKTTGPRIDRGLNLRNHNFPKSRFKARLQNDLGKVIAWQGPEMARLFPHPQTDVISTKIPNQSFGEGTSTRVLHYEEKLEGHIFSDRAP